MVPDDEALGQEPQSPLSRPSASLNRLEETIESLEQILLDLRLQIRIHRRMIKLRRPIHCSACGEKDSDSSDILLSNSAMLDQTSSRNLGESGTGSAENSNGSPLRLRFSRRLQSLS